MAPVGIMDRFKMLYTKRPHHNPPTLSVNTAAVLSVSKHVLAHGSILLTKKVLVTLGYVVPFYISKTTRPSPSLSRDAPSVIRSRVRAVSMACVASTVFVLVLIALKGDNTWLPEALNLLGWWPIGIVEIIKSLLLTAILFSGPLFERGVAEDGWKSWIRGEGLSETLRSWIGFRNYVAGPITEEIIFRSIIITLHLLAKMSPGRIVFVSPLYFGIAHVHHFYEFRLTHPDTPIAAILFRSIFQFGYTTVFGWFAAFLYLRTGSLPAVILVHSFCNWCGLPRLWGRVEAGVPIGPPQMRAKEDSEISPLQVAGRQLGISWTVAYYVLLVTGAVGFYYSLWPLTESKLALATF
ncbi:hypothetical protein TCE0_041f13445 [Talaromyces pinophilus]|uniref:intramembrane prenyl-peptidase Rce1 n=1 Tax=Talaromyces pinophilus TaxID=128442 RepID=A0A6V8HFU1_TALPI|nr:hypothetical protein TCE0_041f13445 [Talaromyces pinophilus]